MKLSRSLALAPLQGPTLSCLQIQSMLAALGLALMKPLNPNPFHGSSLGSHQGGRAHPHPQETVDMAAPTLALRCDVCVPLVPTLGEHTCGGVGGICLNRTI